MIVGLVGVLKSGSAYLPIDPEYPAECMAFMLEDAQPKVVLNRAEWARRLPELARYAETNPTDRERTRPLKLQHPAYLIYTSGSTGRPKGAVITHRGIANLAGAQIERFELVQPSLHQIFIERVGAQGVETGMSGHG